MTVVAQTGAATVALTVASSIAQTLAPAVANIQSMFAVCQAIVQAKMVRALVLYAVAPRGERQGPKGRMAKIWSH